MKIKFNPEPIKDLNGEDLQERTIHGLKAMTEKSVCEGALISYLEGDDKVTPADKLIRFNLATKIHQSGDEIDLVTDEITLIKNLVSKKYSVLVFGRIYYLLEKK